GEDVHTAPGEGELVTVAIDSEQHGGGGLGAAIAVRPKYYRRHRSTKRLNSSGAGIKNAIDDGAVNSHFGPNRDDADEPRQLSACACGRSCEAYRPTGDWSSAGSGRI